MVEHSEKISALMDGEFDKASLDALCHRLKEGDAFAVWADYHLIGDLLRANHVTSGASGQQSHPQQFCARFSAALAAEPTVIASTTWYAAQRKTSPLKALAAAAAIASVGFASWAVFSNVERNTAVPVASVAAGAFDQIPASSSSRHVSTTSRANPYADYVALHQANLQIANAEVPARTGHPAVSLQTDGQ